MLPILTPTKQLWALNNNSDSNVTFVDPEGFYKASFKDSGSLILTKYSGKPQSEADEDPYFSNKRTIEIDDIDDMIERLTALKKFKI